CASANTAASSSSRKNVDSRTEKLLINDFSKHRQLTDEVKHKEVQKHIKSFTKDPRIFNHLDSDRLVIMSYILNEIKKRDMPAELAMIPLIESSYKPAASNKGQYVGLWQFGKQTAKNFGIDVKNNYDGRYSPAASTKAALDYLEYLNKMFDGDWLLTMAAYNAGEGRVLRSIKANRQRGKGTDYWSIDLPKITKAYIPKVLALSEVIAERDKLSKIEQVDIPELVRIRTDSPEKLNRIIKASNIPKDVIEFYNPNVAKRNNVKGIMLPETEIKHLKGVPKKELDKYIIYGSTKKTMKS
ncbi:transglycosylase SLT domain-containing protein, partial [Wohlfahrtiimonas larvae]